MPPNDPAYSIDFEYAYMQDPTFNGGEASCMIARVIVNGEPVELARLIFHGVTRSIRRVSMYTYDDVGQFLGYFPIEDVEDGPFPPTNGEQQVYFASGGYTSPDGWDGAYQWEVHAASFVVERVE